MNPCVNNTPVERIGEALWVKREDLCCPGGPDFSKMRGVYAHLAKRPESVIGVLDSYHSQAGHAVARAGALLGKRVINFYPDFKREPGPRPQQLRALACGAVLWSLPAGMSAVLWHQARKHLPAGAYMMPNGLQLPESIAETRAEVIRTGFPVEFNTVVIAASSGTIAQGVVEGFLDRPEALIYRPPRFIIHMGYSRAHEPMRAKFPTAANVELVDEGYAYKDKAKAGYPAPFPCNEYYDLKAWNWLVSTSLLTNNTLFWNIGA